MTSLCVTRRRIYRDSGESKRLGAVDGERLNRTVLQSQAGDGGSGQTMGIEELWFCFTAIASLGVPPPGSSAVDDGTRRASDGDVGPGDRDEGTGPLFVAESCRARESELVVVR